MFEFSAGDFERPPYSSKCKYCGKANFEWEMRGNKWRLVGIDGKIHDCRMSSKAEHMTTCAKNAHTGNPVDLCRACASVLEFMCAGLQEVISEMETTRNKE